MSFDPGYPFGGQAPGGRADLSVAGEQIGDGDELSTAMGRRRRWVVDESVAGLVLADANRPVSARTFIGTALVPSDVSNHTFALVLVGTFWLSVALAVGADATGRGRYGSVWGITTFVFGPVGLVLYALVLLSAAARSDGEPNDVAGSGADGEGDGPTASIVRSGSRAYCGDCNARVAFDADGCPNCGSHF